MNKKLLSFELDAENYKIHNILNQDFLELELWMIADHEPNNNMSHFTLESMQDGIKTIYNKPILGAFRQMDNEETGDLAGHDSQLNVDEESDSEYFDNSGPYMEVPLGLIPESSKVEIVKGEDGANWIKANGFLWVKYAVKPVLALLRRRKGHCKISVEVEVLEFEEDEETGIEHIKKFNFLGVTCLGSYPIKHAALLGLTGDAARQEIHEGIEGARLNVLNFSQKPEFQEQLQKMTMAYQEFEKAMNSKMNFNNSKSIQNENNSEKVSEANHHEGEDIYHPVPEHPDNEDVPVIGYDEENSNEDSNKDSDENDEKTKETNSRKGKKFSMLTYNMKRQLLESALSECIAKSFGENSKVYGWVQDFSDIEVYFYLDYIEGEGTYVAPYSLTMSSENGEEKVENCVIDFSSKEKAVQTWKKMSEEDGDDKGSKGTEDKETMEKDKFNNDVAQTPEDNGITVPEHFDDRNTEAPKSGTDDRGHAAPKSGDDRGKPKSGTHENHSEDDKEKETEACDDTEKECHAEEDVEKECHAEDDADKKETEACDCDKETESCDDKETEAKKVTDVPSESAGGDKKVTKVRSHSEDDKEKETEACDDTEKECHAEDDTDKKETECNKFAEIQKENEALKAMNVKFQSEIAELNAKIASFEAKEKETQYTNLFNFAVNMINAESDLSEDCRKTMSAEVETECKAGKFSSEDEVKKFTITKIAMALYENKINNKTEKSGKKEGFVQSIVKPNNNVGSKTETGTAKSLASKRAALEALD